VVELEHVQQAYGDHVVYRDLNFRPSAASARARRPQRRGQVHAPEDPRRGDPDPGRHPRARQQRVPGYFAQNRLDNLDPGATVFENVMELRTNENRS
jgi:ATP-binding cassette, subfamily F, member 3